MQALVALCNVTIDQRYVSLFYMRNLSLEKVYLLIKTSHSQNGNIYVQGIFRFLQRNAACGVEDEDGETIEEQGEKEEGQG